MSNQSTTRGELEWSQADVFAEAPLEGNMLAIFHDGRGLTDEEMQALARETNLSETTFILPREQPVEQARGVRVRIFTTREELPFAGHPTLGTAAFLRLHHPQYRGANAISLELNVGTVVVRFDGAVSEGSRSVVGEMTQHDPTFGTIADPTRSAAALGLAVGDLHPDLLPQVVSTGLPFLIVPLRSVDAAARISIAAAPLERLVAECGAHFVYGIAPVQDGPDAPMWHARMPFYNGDDPATGSAAGCAISYLVRHGVVAPEQAVVIRQGTEMRRPSRIIVKASLDEAVVRNVRVQGRTIFVAAGRFFLS